jgi:hypothetical protein
MNKIDYVIYAWVVGFVILLHVAWDANPSCEPPARWVCEGGKCRCVPSARGTR